MKRVFTALVFLALLLSAAVPTRSAEVLSDYHAAIDIARDGRIRVRETIRANVEGDRIRRGLYRDVPLTFVDDAGRTVRVDFELVSVERDGRAEPYRTDAIRGGIRIYTGDPDVLLSRGEHTFRITYETARQIRFFADHDEFYWNVTGTEWVFPIERASATVILPEGVKSEALAVFTGVEGATGKDARARQDGDALVFATTRPLLPREGLTIAVRMPKGSIAPPSAARRQRLWFQDNLASILALSGLVLVALYYGLTWRRIGRDPARGVIVPRWDAPEGISPALVNYIDNKGFSGQGFTALSAAALNLAVGGHVVLEDLKASVVITATGKSAGKDTGLATGEAALLKAVADAGGRLVIDRANGPAVAKAGAGFRAAMEKEHRGKYYRANTLSIVGGLGLSALVLVGVLAVGSVSIDTLSLILIPLLLSFFIGTSVLGVGRRLWRAKSLGGRIAAIAVLALFSFLLLSMTGGFALFAFFTVDRFDELPVLIGIGGVLLVNAVFFFLMGAPTPIGARMMDGIDGLRQYLTLAEKDRMNSRGAPQMSPQHFETLLPYAVALGVERPWSQTFDRWLLAAAAGVATYQPGWYRGSSFAAGSFGDRMGGFAGSMADTMSAALPPPPRSSASGFSAGGGSSGGGGGGGGGGGW